MPYEIATSSSGYCVRKQGGALVPGGCHKSKSKALRHMRALYANEREATKAAHYDQIDFTPPASVRATAEAGLAKRREFGRGGTEVGIARARDLSGGKSISPDTVRRMVSFFARHEVDKRASGFNAGEEGYPSNGRIAWELWGGDAGQAWASKLVRQMEAAETTKEHTGVMVALPVPQEHWPFIAELQAQLPRGAEKVPVEESHVTLLYLGDASEIERLKRHVYVGALNSLEWQDDIPARLTGLARFNGSEGGKNPLVLLVDSPMLPGFRQRLFSLLTDRGVPDNQRHGFIPHITLGYIPTDAKTPQLEVPQERIVFNSLVVAWGDERLVVPLSGAAVYKEDGKGYGARAGETIRGNLTRGNDGKFASAGSSQPAAAESEEARPPRRQKLGRAAAAREERKRRTTEAKRQARAAETEKRRQERAARREAEKKRRQEAKRTESERKLQENRKKVLEKVPLNAKAYDALLAFSEARDDADMDMIEAIAFETGLITRGTDGSFRMNADGKALLRAMDAGNARAALDAFSSAADRLNKEEEREAKRREREAEEEESEKSIALKHGKHNQAAHGRRFSSSRKQLKASARAAAIAEADSQNWEDPLTQALMGSREFFIENESRRLYREALSQRTITRMIASDLSQNDRLLLQHIASTSGNSDPFRNAMYNARYPSDAQSMAYINQGLVSRGLATQTRRGDISQYALTSEGRRLLGSIVQQ